MQNTAASLVWAGEYLSAQGYILNGLAEDVQTTPWSHVTRFSTSLGYIYLKIMPSALAMEPDVIGILYQQFHVNVPRVLASNKELNCFLMKDAGNPLRALFKNGFRSDLLCEGLRKYSEIQHAVINHLDLFFNLGVPDWRLDKLPSLYLQLIQQKEMLIEDGITIDELNSLRALQATVASLCERLSQRNIPETLDHCDFHDNNILMADEAHRMTIIDLGEVVISHPFFSVITCIDKAAFHYSFKETDFTYQALQNAYFESWLEFENKEALLETYSLAKKLWFIYDSLGQYRLMQSTNAEQFKSLNRKGKLSAGLKAFICQ